MKTNIIINIISLIFIISVFSCSEPIDIDVEDIDKRIVLNSFINPDSLINVNISKSIGILENDNNIQFIEGAEVRLFENDVFKEDMQYDSSGYYSASIYPQIGNEYEITVDYSPLQSVNAYTNILEPVLISSTNADAELMVFNETWYNSETGEPFDTLIYKLNSLNIELSFNDPIEDENYYFLTFSALMPQYKHFPPNYEPVYIGDIMTNLDYSSSNLGWESYFYMSNFIGYVISDELFNGSSKSILANIYLYDIYYYGSTTTGSSENIDKVYINLHTISKEFYQYVISYSNYQNTNGNPFAEPVNIMTNVNNGFGFFAAYSTAKDSIIIDYENIEE